MPIGAHAAIANGEMTLVAVVLALDGAQAIRTESRGSMTEALTLGRTAAEDLLAQGADTVLDAVRRAHAAVEGIQP
jgi:hydroxymethylbilane synthase